MDWFSGDIGSAVSQCKAQGHTLLVYIKGSDDLSNNMDRLWEDPNVVRTFQRRQCIKLRLDVNSVGGKQFSQIYPVLMVPSTFFITSSGVPVETIPGECSADVLIEKATKTIKPTGELASASASDLEGAAGASVDTTDGPHSSNTTPAEESFEDDHAEDASMSPEEKEAKIERAKELMAEKQKLKAAEEKEKARLVEVERRRLGQDLNKLKEFKAEQEAKETRDAIRKEKEETRLAREKVREQIQRDREARSAKYNKEKEEKELAAKAKQQERLRKEADEAARITAERSTKARLQFRQPDGSSINHVFEAEGKLQDARDFLSQQPSHTMGSAFRLATIYPRRVFMPQDNQSTFRELELVPSSALLVLPPVRGGSSGGGGGETMTPASPQSSSTSLMYWVSLLLSPISYIWGLITGYLSPATGPAAAAAGSLSSSQDRKDTSTQQSSGGGVNMAVRNRRVGRLSDLPRDGDDENTWNGNSTQQK